MILINFSVINLFHLLPVSRNKNLVVDDSRGGESALRYWLSYLCVEFQTADTEAGGLSRNFMIFAFLIDIKDVELNEIGLLTIYCISRREGSSIECVTWCFICSSKEQLSNSVQSSQGDNFKTFSSNWRTLRTPPPPSCISPVRTLTQYKSLQLK